MSKVIEKPYRQPRYPEIKCLHISRRGHECHEEKSHFITFFCDRHNHLHSEAQNRELNRIWKKQKYEYNEQKNPGLYFQQAEKDFLWAIQSAIGCNYNVLDDDIYYDDEKGIAEFPDGTRYKISLVKIDS
jgi:hypothetical protein